jgi:hypothetical protein
MAEKAGSRKSRKRATGKVSVSMVGFFDILGFANEVENVDSEEELLNVAAKVESIRRHFEFRPKETDIRQMQAILGKEVLAFSDCVVTAVSVQTSFARQEGIFDTLGSQLADIGLSQFQCIADGYFLRGGIDFGIWYHRRGLLVSPAMVAAYKEERDRARYPVIAITPGLHKLLRDDKGRKMYSKDADPFPNEISSFVDPKNGRVYFINYLRICADSVDWQFDNATRAAYRAAPADSDERDEIMASGRRKSLIAFFRQHKERIESAHKAAGEKIKDKYVFLAKYHNKELGRFKSLKGEKLRIALA